MLYSNRLLVVDDEPEFATLVAEVGEALGYKAMTLHSAREFKEHFEEFRPAVCVIDIIMPEEDGVRLLEWLSKREEWPRIIIVSGYNPYYLRLANLLASGRGLNVAETLKKPVSMSVLRAALGPPRETPQPTSMVLPEILSAGE